MDRKFSIRQKNSRENENTRNLRCNLMWSSIYRVTRMIHNAFLKTFLWSIMNEMPYKRSDTHWPTKKTNKIQHTILIFIIVIEVLS